MPQRLQEEKKIHPLRAKLYRKAKREVNGSLSFMARKRINAY